MGHSEEDDEEDQDEDDDEEEDEGRGTGKGKGKGGKGEEEWEVIDFGEFVVLEVLRLQRIDPEDLGKGVRAVSCWCDAMSCSLPAT
jgi:hypothetical protein